MLPGFSECFAGVGIQSKGPRGFATYVEVAPVYADFPGNLNRIASVELQFPPQCQVDTQRLDSYDTAGSLGGTI